MYAPPFQAMNAPDVYQFIFKSCVTRRLPGSIDMLALYSTDSLPKRLKVLYGLGVLCCGGDCTCVGLGEVVKTAGLVFSPTREIFSVPDY